MSGNKLDSVAAGVIILLLLVITATPTEARRVRVSSGAPEVVQNAQGNAYLSVEIPELLLEPDEQIGEVLLVIEMPQESQLSCMSVFPFDAATTSIPSGSWALTGAQRTLARTRCAGSRESGVLRTRVPVGEIIEQTRVGAIDASSLVIGIAAGDGLIESLSSAALESLDSQSQTWTVTFDALIVSKED